MTLTFDEKLRNYARLAVRVGLGVKPGQRVLVQAPVETAPLARLVVREAYAAGASFVDVRWDDDDVQLARFELAPDGTFEQIDLKIRYLRNSFTSGLMKMLGAI